VKYTRLQNCSLNHFAIVVTRRANDRVSTVLGSVAVKNKYKGKTLRQLGK